MCTHRKPQSGGQNSEFLNSTSDSETTVTLRDPGLRSLKFCISCPETIPELSLTLLEPVRVYVSLHQVLAEVRHLNGIMHGIMKLLAVDGVARDHDEALLEGNGVVEQRGQQGGCNKHSMEGWYHNGTLVRAPDRNRLVGDETVDLGYLFRDIASVQSDI